MNPRYQRLLPFLCGAAMVMTLAILLLRARFDLQQSRAAAQLQESLDGVGGELRAELERGVAVLRAVAGGSAGGAPAGAPTASSPMIWEAWRIVPESGADRDAGNGLARIAERSLRDALRGLPPDTGKVDFLGPFATEAGGNAIALAQAVRGVDGRVQWWGSSATIADLVATAQLAGLVGHGFKVQLLDAHDHLALYQSDDDDMAMPVTTELSFDGLHLQLRAVPRAGWGPPLRWWGSALFMPLAVLLWLSFELRRGREMRMAVGELQESEARRKQVNQLYGNAIEHVATLESRLQVVSMYDTVTGLANRSSLLRRVESCLDMLRQAPNGVIALLTIGFDQVHHITHSFGAEFASRVLVVAAERVEFVLPSKDLLYRIGDFHLAVVLPQAESGASQRLADKIVKEIESPIAMDSHTFLLRPSIGIVETSSGYQYAETFLDHANTALGAVPRDATARYCLFDSSAAKESVSRLQLEADLTRAFEEGEFVLEYEPIVVPVSNKVAGFEALIRWNHPTEGRIPPGKFVPIAVQAGMAHRLNGWVMREAARQASAWRRAGHRELFVNFNLSAEAFLQPNLEEQIGEMLAEFEIPGESLLVELTESTLIQDLRGAARTLQRLNEMGIRAWLDDFGTGYSSLSYLRALPLRGVKIDRSFVERTVVDARDFGFLKSLIDLISYLGMQSIAEGIETREVYELLSLTTCDLYQGYHFSRSMPAAQAERFLIEANGSGRRTQIA